MSDTPIDRELDSKSSTRYSEWFQAHVEQFMEEYNDQLSELDLPEDMERQFRLEYTSDARRRLMDFGLYLWGADRRPVGFAFDAEELTGEEDHRVVCADCGASDPLTFRVGLGPSQEDFSTIFCLSCGHSGPVDEMTRPPSLWANL